MSRLNYDENIHRIVKHFAIRAEELLPIHASLFSGLSGLSLLYSNLYLFTGKELYLKKTIKLLEKSISLAPVSILVQTAFVGSTVSCLIFDR